MNRNRLAEYLTHVVGMFAVMWFSGQAAIELPGLSVPITLQSLAVMVLPLLFGQATIVGLFMWLIAGITGMPVFAGGAQGVEVIFGNSGGYIIGFLVVAYLASLYKNWALKKPIARGIIIFIGLQLLLILIGLSWIRVGQYSEITMETHVLPYVPGLLIKSAVGAAILFGVQRIKPNWI
ncbi:MAG: biotin transporter BioY [Salibacteraceae bacterium]